MVRPSWRWLSGAVIAVAVGAITVRHGLDDAVVAGVFTLPCVVAWLFAAGSGRRGLILLAGLGALFVGLYVWSQVHTDPVVIAAPLVDWAVLAGIGGTVVVLVAVIREGRVTPRVPRDSFVVAGIMLALAPVAMGCTGVGQAVIDDEYDLLPSGPPWSSHATVDEIRPLPAGVALDAHECGNLGAHGPCRDVFLVSATDGVSREVLVERVVAHYSQLGWPLRPVLDGYLGCRPVRGILPWWEHCMRIEKSADAQTDTTTGIDVAPHQVGLFIG